MKYVALLVGVGIGCLIIFSLFLVMSNDGSSSSIGTSVRSFFSVAGRTASEEPEVSSVNVAPNTAGSNSGGFSSYTPISRGNEDQRGSGQGSSSGGSASRPVTQNGYVDPVGTAVSGGGTQHAPSGVTQQTGQSISTSNTENDSVTTAGVSGNGNTDVGTSSPRQPGYPGTFPINEDVMKRLVKISTDLKYEGIYQLKETSSYTISFIYHANYFVILLKKMPWKTVIEEPEAYLRETLGLTSEQLCNIDIDVFMPEDRDPGHDHDMGLSQCPGPKKPTYGM